MVFEPGVDSQGTADGAAMNLVHWAAYPGNRPVCRTGGLPGNWLPCRPLECGQTSESAHEGIGTIEAAVFALLGLLLGFSFAGGTSRLDARRPVAAIHTVSCCALVVAGSNDRTTTLS